MVNASSIYGTIVIGGGSGFIGSAISESLHDIGVRSIAVSRSAAPNTISWNEVSSKGLPKTTKAVINVAGQNVLDPSRRWGSGFKQNVLSSRIKTTETLAKAIKNMEKRPEVFVTISGVGYYKPSLTEEYTEESKGGDHDFFAELCQEWEDAAKLPPELGVRNVIIRSGVVLGMFGGIIKRMYIPFYVGLGGRISTGKQYMPWIHINDIVGLFMFAIEEKHVNGVLNGVAPQIITNYEFTKAMGRAMWRPTLIPMPAIALKIAFGEERAKMMLEGQRVIPKRTLQLGFQYKYPDINSALKSIF